MAAAGPVVQRLVIRVEEGVKLLTASLTPAGATAAAAEDDLVLAGVDNSCLGEEQFGEVSQPGRNE